MERLTYKNHIEEYEVNFEKSSDKNWSIAESDTHIKVTGEPVNKLGELEDVLESWHIENLEELKIRLHDCQVYHLKNNSNETLIHNLKNELADLEAKLAEKDKELSEYVKIVDDLHKQLSDKCDFCDKTKDQDKISFAVEQLEKLKVELHIIHTNGYLKAIDEEINNQINELKGKVEE